VRLSEIRESLEQRKTIDEATKEKHEQQVYMKYQGQEKKTNSVETYVRVSAINTKTKVCSTYTY
jgi:hypothetical protein